MSQNKKRLKLKKWVYYVIFVIILIIVIVIGVNLYKEYKYRQSNEYKLLQLGYTDNEVDILLEKLSNNTVKDLLTKDKDDDVVSFAKENYYSKHNVNCWKQKEYIGFGISAHSYYENIRFSNTEDFNKYINSGYSDFEKFNIKNLLKNINCSELEEETIIENQELSRAKIIKYIELESKGLKTIHEIQTTEEKQKEYMLLGLRMLEGVSISEFKQKFVENPIYLFRESLSKLVEEELIKIDLDNIFLTRKGLDLANLVWEEFV